MKAASQGESYIILFFFFQAEDGIRDVAVTGVQTCALPISFSSARHQKRANERVKVAIQNTVHVAHFKFRAVVLNQTVGLRSEERRVGKECRSRWSPYH